MSNSAFDHANLVDLVVSLSKLRHLNLSRAGLAGTFPYKLGNLSSLHFLDLSYNSYIEADSLPWLSHLSSLKYLDLSIINLSKAVNWFREINILLSLTSLHLLGCFLNDPIPPLPTYFNISTSVSILDLNMNSLVSTSIFTWFSNCSSVLADLRISYNLLQGPIPDAFWNMTSLKRLNLNAQIGDMMENLSAGCSAVALEVLNLGLNKIGGLMPEFARYASLRELHHGKNQIYGLIPKSFGHLPQLLTLSLRVNQLTGPLPDLTKTLREINLSFNELNGTLTNTLEQLPNLQTLYVSSNHFEGVISEAHLSKLSKLQNLDLSLNSLVLNFSSDWVPPFQLATLLLSSCKLGPKFPEWLQKHNNLSQLDISNNGISDTIPSWFWKHSLQLTYLNLSQNQIRGMLPNSSLQFVTVLDLSFNHFEGPLPLFSSASFLDLSHNMFNGTISTVCLCKFLSHFDISNNLLFGRIPNCWSGKLLMSILHFANNKFIGEIPTSIGSLAFLMTLHLHNNRLSGELPLSLKNCSMLELLNVGENKLSGRLPAWLGESHSSLRFLSLRSNAFNGTIPSKRKTQEKSKK